MPDVRFFGSDSNTFGVGYNLGENIFGQGFNDDTFVVNLSESLSPDIQAISVWCLGVGVSFGDGLFN